MPITDRTSRPRVDTPASSESEPAVRVKTEQWDGGIASLSTRGRDRSKDRLRVLAETKSFAGVNWKLEAKVAEARRSKDQTAARWISDDPFDPERDTVSTTHLTVSALDKRLRLTSSQALSQFREDFELRTSRRQRDMNDLRGIRNIENGQQGMALWQRVDFDVLRGNTRLSGFARTSNVDLDFDDEVLDRRDRPFSRPGERRVSYGANLGWRPIDVTLSAKQETQAEALEDDWRELELTSATSRAVTVLLRPFEGTFKQSGALSLLPDTLWASLENGSVNPGIDSVESDAFGLHAFRIAWTRSAFYADAGYWSYTYDGRQPWSPEADWIGKRVYAGGGYVASKWRGYLYFGRDTGDNQERYSRSANTNYTGSASFSYLPDELPNLDLNVTRGDYRTEYLVYDGEVGTALWQFGLELDFAKFVDGLRENPNGRLAAFYWIESEDHSDDFGGGSVETEHILGLRFTRSLP